MKLPALLVFLSVISASAALPAYLKASNTQSNDSFGYAVAVSGDTMVVGAPGEDGGGTGVNPPSNEAASSAGAVYVFVRGGGVWTQQAYLKASNSGADDGFGTSVAIAGKDYDNDSFVNLIEFAFGMNPVAAGGGLLPQPQINGGNFTIAFTQPAGVDGITYGVEYSLALAAGPWLPLTDTGTAGNHAFSVSTDGRQKLFLRLTAAPQ